MGIIKSRQQSGMPVVAFDEPTVNMMERLIRNGYDYSELGKLLGITERAMGWNLRRRVNKEVRKRLDMAVHETVERATKAMEKMAYGYYEDEVVYSQNFKENGALKKLFGEMMKFIPPEKAKTYKFKLRMEAIVEEGMAKRTTKYYPPNKDAAKLLLEIHRPDVWDLETKRKKIPDVKIVVTVDDRKRISEGTIKPDYEVVN